jgi:hypothetical protein
MPQQPHTIPSTPHRGSGVLPAMVSGGRCSVGAVSIQNSKFKIPHSLPSAPLTFPTLSTILHPHEHGQNPLDPRSSQHRASSSPCDCGMLGVGRQGMSDSGLSSRSSSIAKSHYEGSLPRLLVIAEQIQSQDDQVDVYSLDRTVHLCIRRHQVPLTPVAAVCDRRRPQGRHTAPSAPPRLRVNPSAILDRMTGFAGYTGVFRQNRSEAEKDCRRQPEG